MNQVILIGRLTKDPTEHFLSDETAVATFIIAVDRPYAKNKEADFFKIVVYGKRAENCIKYLSKGKQIGISGRIQNDNYQTKSGEKRYSTDVIANTVEFLSPKGPKENDPNLPEGYKECDDEMPF